MLLTFQGSPNDSAGKSSEEQLSLLAQDWEDSRRDFLKRNTFRGKSKASWDMLLFLTTVLRGVALGDQERE